MKRIRELKDATPGLADFRRAEGDNAPWSTLRSRKWRAERRELQDALTLNQHGLCAYCEIDIYDPSRRNISRRQIEHVVPRSGDDRALDLTNMVACCTGGTVRALDDEEGEGEGEGHFREPIADNMSCGQAKGGRNDPVFVDPRTLPDLPSLTRVGDGGLIETDEGACESAGFSPGGMSRTLKILNLNAERLRLARRKWRNTLVEQSQDIDDPDQMNVWIRSVLTPDADGRLLRFFTTSRGYFAPLSERILEEHPQTWI